LKKHEIIIPSPFLSPIFSLPALSSYVLVPCNSKILVKKRKQTEEAEKYLLEASKASFEIIVIFSYNIDNFSMSKRNNC